MTAMIDAFVLQFIIAFLMGHVNDILVLDLAKFTFTTITLEIGAYMPSVLVLNHRFILILIYQSIFLKKIFKLQILLTTLVELSLLVCFPSDHLTVQYI